MAAISHKESRVRDSQGPSLTANQLFAAFIGGDDDAFARLFQAFNADIYVYCAKMLGNPEHGEDAAQNVWMQMLRLRGTAIEVQNLRGFLFTVARNICLGQIKRESRFTQFDPTDESTHPTHYDHGEDRSRLEEQALEALDQLPTDFREILVMFYYNDYRCEEIGNILDISTDLVYQRLTRGRAMLRRMVNEMTLKEKL